MATKVETLAAVNRLSSSLKKTVQDGRSNYEQSKDINDFVKSHGEKDLHGLLALYPVQLYAGCFKSLGVKSRRQLEALWSQHFQDDEMQEAVKDLMLAEEGYRAFIEELDQIMAAYEEQTALPVVGVGGQISTDADFVDGSTGCAVSLKDLLQKSSYTLFVLRKHYV